MTADDRVPAMCLDCDLWGSRLSLLFLCLGWCGEGCSGAAGHVGRWPQWFQASALSLLNPPSARVIFRGVTPPQLRLCPHALPAGHMARGT